MKPHISIGLIVNLLIKYFLHSIFYTISHRAVLEPARDMFYDGENGSSGD